jgi:hypothetical protein
MNFVEMSASNYTTMDTLQDTEWDVLISGTGIHQSLLALSVVSRILIGLI